MGEGDGESGCASDDSALGDAIALIFFLLSAARAFNETVTNEGLKFGRKLLYSFFSFSFRLLGIGCLALSAVPALLQA